MPRSELTRLDEIINLHTGENQAVAATSTGAPVL
jgi:hypothetical protein